MEGCVCVQKRLRDLNLDLALAVLLTLFMLVVNAAIFANSEGNRTVLLLGVAEMSVFIFYLLYMMKKYKREKCLYMKQIKSSHEIYRIQQHLFDAYDNPRMVDEALKLTAMATEMEFLFFISVYNKSIHEFYCWPKVMQDAMLRQMDNIKESIPEIYKPLTEGETIKLAERHIEYYRKAGRMDKLAGQLIKNMVLVPVLNTEGLLSGVLVGANTHSLSYAAKMLEVVAATFLMSVRNLNAYKLVEHMGTEDALTGLKNRNAYQYTLSQYEAEKNPRMCCIYIDANGLHDLNNSFGHEAGDNLLLTISELLRRLFGTEDCYRIGGDEFVAFTHELSEADVHERLAKLEELLAEKNYHASAGYAFRADKPLVQQMIKEAEKEMYHAKNRYYMENNITRRKNSAE